MDNEKQELLSLVEEKRSEIIDLLCALVQVNTTIPPGDTREAILILQDYLSQYDLEGRVIESTEEKHNLIVETGHDHRSNLCLNGHLDVVPVEEEDWDFDPFLGALRDGQILGRGASDMKSGLVGLVFAFVHLEKYFEEDKLTLMAVSDEERGGLEGTNRVLHQLGDGYDACLIAEPTRPHSISVGQKGAVWVKFTLQGTGGHGSLAPFNGREVFGEVSELKEKLESLRGDSSEMLGVPEGLVEYSRETLRRLTDDPDAGSLLDHIGVNCGKIRIGNAPNSVGSHANLWCDFRLPIGMKLDHLRNRLEEIVNEIPTVTSYEFIKEKSASWTHPDSRLVRLLSENAREHYTEEPDTFLHQGSSDASYFRMKGIDTAQIGPGNIEKVHAPNETVDVEDVMKSIRTYVGFLYDWQNYQ